MTTYQYDPDTTTDLERDLRILDDATNAARQELDEIATLVVRANPLDAIPRVLLSRLHAATGRVDGLEARRELIRRDLLAHRA